MPKIPYIEKKLQEKTLVIIEQANEIISEYVSEGYDLTVRQVFYQFVARGLIENTQASYNKLAHILTDARLVGLIDWNYIVDRTRNVEENSHWDSPKELLETASMQFQINKWDNQPYIPEIGLKKTLLRVSLRVFVVS